MILLVQPPFVQLNTPYPSLYYLKTFLESEGYTTQIQDHSIDVFHRIFSRQGLKRIFADGETALRKDSRLGKDQQQIAWSYISQQDKWLDQIEHLISFLQGKNREYAHLLCLCNNLLPQGPRTSSLMERFEGNLLPDQAVLLASTLLADLADFITAVLDPTFSLVKYADTLAASIRSFKTVETALDGYILRQFYQEFLEEST
ncbi:MAG: radical SAM protein, partial [Termitinemataceae bacterium]